MLDHNDNRNRRSVSDDSEQDDGNDDEEINIPQIVLGGSHVAYFPIHVLIGRQRASVMTCWSWLRDMKHDSFLYALFGGGRGDGDGLVWKEQHEFLESITEDSPIPVLRLLPDLDAFEDQECIDLILMFRLLHATVFDKDPVITPKAAKAKPGYASRVSLIIKETMDTPDLVRLISLADKYGL